MRPMSTDGAGDQLRSARPARSDERGIGQIALVLLLALAVIATIVMVFTDNAVWMRIGTLAALWAAFIGAFLVGRYRRQAAQESSRVRDLHTVYELQLEREISARREHELVVERDLRERVRGETDESVLALRQEIQALREQLGHLTGGPLPEDRTSLSGGGAAGSLGAPAARTSVPSERVRPRGGDDAPESGSRWSGLSDRMSRGSAGESSDPARTGGSTGSDSTGSESTGSASAGSSPMGSSGVGRDATPSTERTGRIDPVAADRDLGGRAQRGPAVRPASPENAESRRSARGSDWGGSSGWGAQSGWERPAEQRAPQPQPEQRRQPEQQAPQQQQSEQRRQPEPQTRQQPEPQQDQDRPRRARTETPEQAAAREELHSRHSSGSTVAELLARLGSEEPSTGGRRRRADD